MAKGESTPQSTGHRLKGNAMLGKKVTLRRFENATVSLMMEFYCDESNHIKECQKLMNSINTIEQMIRKEWGPE